jgi:HlyD family secretion protein
MASRKAKIGVGIAVAVVLAGIVAVNVTKDLRNRTVVQTGTAAKRDLVSIVAASGEVKPKRYVNIGSNVSGRIVELTVVEGDAVKRGQVLARIESERFEAATRQSRAAVDAAKADLQRAEADLEVSSLAFDRTKKMFDDKLVSAQDFDQADAERKMKAANLEAARKRVAQLQAQLDSNLDDLTKTTVVSPMDGVVTSLPKEEGEVVIGAQSFNPTVIMTVADLSVMECEIMVDETDIRSVKLGQKAEVRVDALEDLTLEGDVTEIGASAIPRGQTAAQTQQTSTAGNTGNQAKDFRVTITLNDPPRSLRPGLNATAEITTARREDVLAVPIQAVVVRQVDKEGKVVEASATPPPQDQNTVLETNKPRLDEQEGVFLVQKDKAVFRRVKTGIMGETDIEVSEGLSPGDTIVTGSFKTLRSLKDQDRIKLEKEKKKS